MSYIAAMLLEHKSYRNFLKDVLAQRAQKNPSYSLRAFATQIGLDHSSLVQIFNGDRNLSSDRAYIVGSKLNLTDLELEYFQLLVRFESAKNVELKSILEERINALRPIEKTHDLTVDLFKVISDWYHLPLLHLSYLSNFVLTAESAAKKLGISIHEAESAIDRLERLELLEKDSRGKFKPTHARTLVDSKIQNAALRKFHQQMLEKASSAMETQTPDERITSTETFAFDPDQIEKVKKVVDQCLLQITKIAKASKKKTHVYHAAVNVFRITKDQQ